MANRNAPFGLRAYRQLGGGTPGRQAEYTIADAYGSNIGYGQPVVSTGAGRDISAAAADGGQRGVFAGCKYRNAQGEIVYANKWTASTATFAAEGAVAYVIDDPNTVFIVQMSLGFVATNVGLLADLVIGAPDALGNSTVAVDSTDLAGSAVKILGLVNRPNNAYGNYAVVEVLLGNHELHERVAV